MPSRWAATSSTSTDRLSGDVGDHLLGGAGDDRLYGGPGDERLAGGNRAARQALRRLRRRYPPGGPGADDIRGGPGNDVFVFAGRSRAGGGECRPRYGRERRVDHPPGQYRGSPPSRHRARSLAAAAVPRNTIVGKARRQRTLRRAAERTSSMDGVATTELTGGAGQGRVRLCHAPSATQCRPDRRLLARQRLIAQQGGLPRPCWGGLPAGAFFAGAAAHDADDRIVYDPRPATSSSTWTATGRRRRPVRAFGCRAALSSGDFLVG